MDQVNGSISDCPPSSSQVHPDEDPQHKSSQIRQSWLNDKDQCVVSDADEMRKRWELQHQHLCQQNDQHTRDLRDIHEKERNFWKEQKSKIDKMSKQEYREASKTCILPMARVKKIMKIDEELNGQMIAHEAPLLLSRAAELFVEELTLKSWVNTEEMRRKTLQKNDISAAVSRNEHFDFLIDIVPREEQKHRFSGGPNAQPSTPHGDNNMVVDKNIQYVLDNGDQNSDNNLLVQLENGQIVSATQIGQPIPLDGDSMHRGLIGSQQLQVVTSASGRHQNGTMISVPATSVSQT